MLVVMLKDPNDRGVLHGLEGGLERRVQRRLRRVLLASTKPPIAPGVGFVIAIVVDNAKVWQATEAGRTEGLTALMK